MREFEEVEAIASPNQHDECRITGKENKQAWRADEDA